MIKNKDMNWLQRFVYGVRWRVLSGQCRVCGGSGEDSDDPIFSCVVCKGTGIEKILTVSTDVFNNDLIDIGWTISTMSVFYSPSNNLSKVICKRRMI